jgi:hypothetical protein
VLAEVVADKGVEEFGICSQMCVGKCHQLPVAGRAGVLACASEELGIAGHDGRGHQKGGRGGVRREAEDLDGRFGVLADQATKKGGVVVRHNHTVDPGADDALTTACPRSGAVVSQGC